MIRPMLAFAAAILLLPMAAMAQSDCYRSMKDLLQGTLQVGIEADSKQDAEPSSACTLAAVRDGANFS